MMQNVAALSKCWWSDLIYIIHFILKPKKNGISDSNFVINRNKFTQIRARECISDERVQSIKLTNLALFHAVLRIPNKVLSV